MKGLGELSTVQKAMLAAAGLVGAGAAGYAAIDEWIGHPPAAEMRFQSVEASLADHAGWREKTEDRQERVHLEQHLTNQRLNRVLCNLENEDSQFYCERQYSDDGAVRLHEAEHEGGH